MKQSADVDRDRLYPLIAHHYRLAGDGNQAAIYYGKAGENAFRDYANQEAVRFLGLALDLGKEDLSALHVPTGIPLIGEANYRLTLEWSKARSTIAGRWRCLAGPCPVRQPDAVWGWRVSCCSRWVIAGCPVVTVGGRRRKNARHFWRQRAPAEGICRSLLQRRRADWRLSTASCPL